jgi:hypothetical protein
MWKLSYTAKSTHAERKISGDYYIDLLIFIYFHLSNLTQILLKQSINFHCKGKQIFVASKANKSKKAVEDLVKKVYKSLHPSFNAAFFASQQMTNNHMNELRTALK